MTTPFTHAEAPQATPQTCPVTAATPGFTTPATDQPAEHIGIDPQVTFSQPAEQTPTPAPVAFDPAPGFKEPK